VPSALLALIAAHRRFAASAIAFRPAAVILRFFGAGFDWGALFFVAAEFAASGALLALMVAQRRRAASAIALRPAALTRRFFGMGAEAEGAGAVFVDGVARGRPRGAGPWSASIALDMRSRSATNKETICSVSIMRIVAIGSPARQWCLALRDDAQVKLATEKRVFRRPFHRRLLIGFPIAHGERVRDNTCTGLEVA